MSYNVFLLYCLPLLVAFLVLKSYFSSSSSKSMKKLPPSPPKLPIIGNLHQLGSGTHRDLQSIAQTYGPIILIHVGTRPIVLVSSADIAKEILKTHDIVFASRPSLSVPNRLSHGATDIAFASYGEYWRRLKSISVLHLLSNKRVNSYRHVREEELNNMIEKIRRSNGSVINLSELVIALTHSIVCRVAFGKTFDGKKYQALINSVGKVMRRFAFENFFPSLTWMDRLTGLHREADEVYKRMDEFYGGIIDRRKNNKEVRAEGQEQDLIDILLEIQRDDSAGFRLERYMIMGIIQDMAAGGTDTTGTLLEWTISEVIKHPHAMKELQQEAHKIGRGRPFIPEEDLDHMPYLKAVLKESLRLHFPNPLLVPHQSTKEVKVHGYDIPSGTQVIVNGWAIARDPLKWNEPDEFKPERFLNSTVDYMGFDFEFLPFGAGRRGCPGIKFAMIINEFALANLVYKFDFTAHGKESVDMSEVAGITLHRKFPVFVKATPRE